ncbi:MAG: alpha-amylase, partial [Bacteroidaceae bacterium]|nr:alpha-amylase [Bacteroidaceae bacterium]
MLQGFYWDSYSDTKWTKLEKQADELSKYFDLIWIPNSGYCGGSNNMGYLPLYYFNQQSSFGTESALRSMISTFKAKGLGTIADVVINHHANISNWVDFPEETYNGTTYQLQSTDICKNDDGGTCKSWADKNGYSLSDNNDTGEDWSGARDLDHKSSNVNTVVKAYLNYLINDLGYCGFRYDMVKGYSASFTADYNTTAQPTFSVGEYWDGSSAIKNWINGTKVNATPTSAAFDFQFRYRVRDAINQNNWTNLADNTNDTNGRPLIYDSN